ncbi:MAG: restriction endonuclease subunit S, partial [Dehalococcoidia bacterium]
AEGLPVLAITQEHGAIPRDQIDYHVSVTAESVASYKEVCEGDFIISLRSFQGGIEYSRYHGICSPAYVILRRRGDENPHFLRHLFKSGRFIQQLTRNIEGIRDGKMISYAQFSEQKIPLPGPAEQRKIADCLDSLDDLIAAQSRMSEALRRHRNGLVQQLFPRPGENMPRQRFPEFEDAADWYEATLGALLSRAPEYGVNAAAVPHSDRLPTYIRITDINEDGRLVPEPRVSVDIDASEEQYLQDGDIVLARTGASVGKSYCYRVEDGPLVFAGFLIRVRPHPERLAARFLAAYLSTWRYWDWVRLTSSRSGQPGINGTEYASMPLLLPPDGDGLAEQTRIADCLAAVDDQIDARLRRLDVLRQHKQGLLQQLFPAPEEEVR